MKLVVAFALLALALAVQAQTPNPCDSPNALEAHIVELDPSKDWSIHAKWSYDDRLHRISIYEDIDESGTHDHFHRIRLFHEKLEYSVNLKTKDCKVGALNREWRRYGVPSNATFEDQFEIGTDAFVMGGVLVNEWSDTFTEGKWHGTFTDIGCLPVSEYFRTTDHNLIHTSFYDITLGIQDPNIFMPPTGCHSHKHL